MKSFATATLLSMVLVARAGLWVQQPQVIQVQSPTVTRYYPAATVAKPVETPAEVTAEVAAELAQVKSKAEEKPEVDAKSLKARQEALQAVKSRVRVVVYGYDGCTPCDKLHKRLEDELAPLGWTVGAGEIRYVTIAKPQPGRVYPRIVCFVDDEPVEDIPAAGNVTVVAVTSLYFKHFNAIDDREKAKPKVSGQKAVGKVARGVCSCGLACDCDDCNCHDTQQLSYVPTYTDSYATYYYTVSHAGRRVFGGWR